MKGVVTMVVVTTLRSPRGPCGSLRDSRAALIGQARWTKHQLVRVEGQRYMWMRTLVGLSLKVKV